MVVIPVTRRRHWSECTRSSQLRSEIVKMLTSEIFFSQLMLDKQEANFSHQRWSFGCHLSSLCSLPRPSVFLIPLLCPLLPRIVTWWGKHPTLANASVSQSVNRNVTPGLSNFSWFVEIILSKITRYEQQCNTVNEQQCSTVQEQQCSTRTEQVSTMKLPTAQHPQICFYAS